MVHPPHVSHVTCHVSLVTCQVLHVRWEVSGVKKNVFFFWWRVLLSMRPTPSSFYAKRTYVWKKKVLSFTDENDLTSNFEDLLTELLYVCIIYNIWKIFKTHWEVTIVKIIPIWQYSYHNSSKKEIFQLLEPLRTYHYETKVTKYRIFFKITRRRKKSSLKLFEIYKLLGWRLLNENKTS